MTRRLSATYEIQAVKRKYLAKNIGTFLSVLARSVTKSVHTLTAECKDSKKSDHRLFNEFTCEKQHPYLYFKFLKTLFFRTALGDVNPAIHIG